MNRSNQKGTQMTSAKSKKEKVAAQKIQYTKGPESAPRFYANNTNATFSNFDLKLTFGQIADVVDDKLPVDPQAIIFMSPQHAKAVVALLSRQLEIFEANNGPISLQIDKSSIA